MGIAEESGIIIKDGDRIAFLGDSITAGGAGYGRYCRLVVQGLKNKGINVKGIYAGISGNTSADMLLRLDGDVLSKKPDFVFLSAGVNDIWHKDHTVKIGVFQAKPGMGVGLEDYKNYVTQIVDKCKTAGAEVILSTVLPIKEDPEFKLNKTSEKYNAFLLELAKEKELPIAQLNKAMFLKIAELRSEKGSESKRNVLTSDGVHPIPLGHQTMAKGILKAMGLTEDELKQVEKEWNSSPKILIMGGRQVSSGGRTGGWINMLMDGLTSGKEMISKDTKTVKNIKISWLSSELKKAIVPGQTKYLLLIPPSEDLENTPIAEFKKSLESIIDVAESNKVKTIISTIPLQEVEETSGSAIDKYNGIIREVVKSKNADLLDINSIMKTYKEKHPEVKLTIGDERFSNVGGMLMAETVLKKLGFDEKKINELRRDVWSERSSYTYVGAYRRKFDLMLSEKGHQVIKEIQERYHKISTPRIINYGMHMLLNGDMSKNIERMEYFDKSYLGKNIDSDVKLYNIYFKLMLSEKQIAEINEFMKKNKIDLKEFYKGAFKVGVVSLRDEDPLGRGKF